MALVLYSRAMIQDVLVKNVKKHQDKQGFFAELVKSGEPSFHKILQTSYAETKPGVIKAWHVHAYWEVWCIIKGKAKVVLYDLRPNSPTHKKTQVIYTGEDNLKIIAIPGNVAHGYKVLNKKTMGIIYHASQVYNPNNITIRTIPRDDPTINFDWTKP